MAWEEVQQRVVNLREPREVAEIRRFLQTFQLGFDADVEYTTALYQNDEMVGTGSFAGSVLRNIAVLPEYQGGGHTAGMVSQLMAEQQRRGIFHYFLFTRPDKAHLFAGLGFREVARLNLTRFSWRPALAPFTNIAVVWARRSRTCRRAGGPVGL